MLIDYLAVGLVYADQAMLRNMFEKKRKAFYSSNPLWLRLIAYFADIALWPLGLLFDLYRYAT